MFRWKMRGKKMKKGMIIGSGRNSRRPERTRFSWRDDLFLAQPRRGMIIDSQKFIVFRVPAGGDFFLFANQAAGPNRKPRSPFFLFFSFFFF